METQKLKDFGNVQWSVVFVKGNFKNQKQISKIRESDKYQNALNFAIVESREIRERVQKQYLKYCKFHKIKPLQLPAL